MEKFVIEDGILKAYFGTEEIVVVPEGVTHIGGDLIDVEDCPKHLKGDPIGYRAFFGNKRIKELYLPDSVVEIGFKALEHCKSLEVLSFSSAMKTFGCNAIVGCIALKKIIYRGTIFEFTCLETPGQTPDLEVVYCTDGEIHFGADREYYIETLFYPGTRAEWNAQFKSSDWRNRRTKSVVCIDEMI